MISSAHATTVLVHRQMSARSNGDLRLAPEVYHLVSYRCNHAVYQVVHLTPTSATRALKAKSNVDNLLALAVFCVFPMRRPAYFLIFLALVSPHPCLGYGSIIQ